MSSTPQPVINKDEVTVGKRKAVLPVALPISAILVAVLAALLSFIWYRKMQALDSRIGDLEFSQAVDEYNAANDFMEPTVNTIQFMRRGYSIVFDTVQYTQEGLVLSGRLGNPTHLWISSLALKFAARPFPYQVRDKWAKNKFLFFLDNLDIGTGQTTIGSIGPGTTSFFNVTIPNVRQTKENFQLVVSFSGERYSYSP